MKITHGTQTIDLFPNEVIEVYSFAILRRIRSASLFYLIPKHSQVNLVPFHVEIKCPLDAEGLLLLLNGSKKTNNNNTDIEIFNFNDKDESFVTFEECDATIEKYSCHRNAQKTSIQNYTSR